MQKNDSPKFINISKIIQETPDVKTFYFDFELNSKPGQFVMLWIPGVDQKPFSISHDDGQTFGLTVFKRGPLTEKLFEMQAGDRVGISGSYGTSFSIQPNTHYIMVAGGYGAAPLAFLASELSKQEGVSIDFCIGARSAQDLLFESRIKSLPNTTLHVATDDGSKGHSGFVTDLFSNLIRENPRRGSASLCVTCGPELMEKAVLDICNEKNVDCEISIERYMKCGVGICGQCAVDDLGICMCQHGPVVNKDLANKIKEFGNFHRDKSGAKHNLNNQKNMDTTKLILKLHEINAIKFGEFKLKSGSLSPIYIDLRVTVSYPDVLKMVAQAMWEKVNNLQFDLICGVPYTALPIATVMSIEHDKPMVMRRKEIKDYGTKKAIEGNFQAGKNCLVVEDLITSGSSVFETIAPLEHEGLRVTDIVVLLDREQGGDQNIRAKGYTPHSILNMSELLNTLREYGKIDNEMYSKVQNYLQVNQTSQNNFQETNNSLTYGQRANLTSNAVAKKLFNLMEEKQTNLCVALDVTKKYELLKLAESIGPEICVLKTHIDIIEDFDQDLIYQLQRLAEHYNFIIFEDRKFADIGNTVKHQYQNGIYHIVDWAHITNAHTVPGPGIIMGLKEVGLPKERGLLLLAEMSSEGALAQGEYTEKTLQMAQEHKDFVIGFITMKKIVDDPGFINMTPGVQLQSGMDNLGQQFKTPDLVIRQNKSDIIIVGRGIYQAGNPIEEARKYRQAGWEAYKNRL